MDKPLTFFLKWGVAYQNNRNKRLIRIAESSVSVKVVSVIKSG